MPDTGTNVVPTLRRSTLQARLQHVASRFHWFAMENSEELSNMTPERARLLTIDAIEDGTNDFIVVLVAAAGFFADSYILFSTNIILPMLDYVYWGSAKVPKHETAINCATLAGCVAGQLIFGFLGDKYGRRKLYGFVLLMLIGGTLGLCMSSPGYPSVERLQGKDSFEVDWTKAGSMDVVSWLVFWRFVSGIGIGGDYPLSAVMVSEMAPTKRRARMLATLFSMQAFGYLFATVLALIVVSVVRSRHPDPTQVAIDQTWRWVMGLGLIPASVAAIMRCFVPESPRFTLYVLNYPFRALQEADILNQAGVQDRYQQEYEDDAIRNFGHRKRDSNHSPAASSSNSTRNGQSRPVEEFEIREPAISARRKRNAITLRKFYRYLRKDGNAWKLFASASSWFLLDFTFFGLGFNTPQNMSKIWEGSSSLAGKPTPPLWDTDWNHPGSTIYHILIQDNVRSLVTSSIGAILGTILLIFMIERFNRRRLLYLGFLVLTLLFIIIGASYQATINNYRGATITLYAITQFFFYFGPNALTFIVAAELFPTRFRCTCHGISAAAGKLGSIVVQLVLAYSEIPGGCDQSNNDNASDNNSSTSSQPACKISSPQSNWLGWIIFIFAAPMALGMIVTWWKIPEIQEREGPKRYENFSLERLGEEYRDSSVQRRSPRGRGNSGGDLESRDGGQSGGRRAENAIGPADEREPEDTPGERLGTRHDPPSSRSRRERMDGQRPSPR